MKLQEEHLEAIQQSKSESYFPEYSEHFSEDMCREKATQITKDYMKRFAEWCNYPIYRSPGELEFRPRVIPQYPDNSLFIIIDETGYSILPKGKFLNIDELIEIFLETEK